MNYTSSSFNIKSKFNKNNSKININKITNKQNFKIKTGNGFYSKTNFFNKTKSNFSLDLRFKQIHDIYSETFYNPQKISYLKRFDNIDKGSIEAKIYKLDKYKNYLDIIIENFKSEKLKYKNDIKSIKYEIKQLCDNSNFLFDIYKFNKNRRDIENMLSSEKNKLQDKLEKDKNENIILINQIESNLIRL